MGKFSEVVDLLTDTGSLPAQYRPHKLSGQFKDIWECHIQPDWLLPWKQDKDKLILLFIDTGSHSEIFG